MLNQIYKECILKMDKTISNMKRDFKTLRTGKVSISILDIIRVDCYGMTSNLKEVGTVSIVDGTTILINPWDKTLLSNIERALVAANLGVNPNSDGTRIRLIFPPMNVEQRKRTVKQMKKMGEDAKVSVRLSRQNANSEVKKLEQQKLITSDQVKGSRIIVQKITKEYTYRIDQILKAKEVEILKI